jgi:hypothetical protein
MGKFTTVHQLSNVDRNMVRVDLQWFTNYKMQMATYDRSIYNCSPIKYKWQ